MCELRVAVPNRPGVVAEVALALGRGGVNIADMALHPAPDRSSGFIVLWIAGAEHAAAGRGARGRARAAGGARVNAVFRPARGACAGRSCRRPTSRSRIAPRCSAAMSAAPVHVTNYLDAEDTRSSLAAIRALGAQVEERAGGLLISGPGLRGATPGVAIDVGNAGTLMRLLPGWLAGQPEGGRWTLDGDECIRRRPGRPHRAPARARWAPRCRPRDGPLPAASRSPAGRCAGSSTSCPSPPRRSRAACCSRGCSPTGSTTVVEPEPSRDHTERLLARAGAGIVRDGDRVTVGRQDELRLEAIQVPGDPSSAAFLVAAAVLVPGSRLAMHGHGGQLDARRLLQDPRSAWARR